MYTHRTVIVCPSRFHFCVGKTAVDVKRNKRGVPKGTQLRSHEGPSTTYGTLAAIPTGRDMTCWKLWHTLKQFKSKRNDVQERTDPRARALIEERENKKALHIMLMGCAPGRDCTLNILLMKDPRDSYRHRSHPVHYSSVKAKRSPGRRWTREAHEDQYELDK